MSDQVCCAHLVHKGIAKELSSTVAKEEFAIGRLKYEYCMWY